MAFEKIFDKDYSCFLNEINYQVKTVGATKDRVKLVIEDDLFFEQTNNSTLKVIIKRSLKFDPNLVFDLVVSYGAILPIKEGAEIDGIDWNDEFKNSPLGMAVIARLLSRISLQIAQITSANGQNPIITPPKLVEKE